MAEQVRFCPACGHDNLPGFQFCGRCGAALPPAEPRTGEPPQAAAAEAIAADSAESPAPTTVTEFQAPTAVEYAGFWLRFIALVIDGAVVFVVLVILKGISSFIQPIFYSYFYWWDLPGFFLWQGPPLWLILLAYHWLLTGLSGQTLGKMAVGIRGVNRAGRTPGLGRAALRELLAKQVLHLLIVGPILAVAAFVWLTFFLPYGGLLRDIPVALWLVPAGAAAFLALGLGGFLSMIWDSEKRGWHDKRAGTFVVKKPRGSLP